MGNNPSGHHFSHFIRYFFKVVFCFFFFEKYLIYTEYPVLGDLGEARAGPQVSTPTWTCLCSDLELLVLLQQLLGVLHAWARGGVRGQVELPIVMDPLQSLGREGMGIRSRLSTPWYLIWMWGPMPRRSHTRREPRQERQASEISLTIPQLKEKNDILENYNHITCVATISLRVS